MDDFVSMEFEDIMPEYDSPIAIEFKETVADQLDEAVFRVIEKVNINVSREKLEKALTQDRERYEEAYQRGFTNGWKKGWHDAKEDEK